MEVDRILELATNEEDLNKIEQMVPADIFYIRNVVKELACDSLARKRALLVWIQALLKNPFSISKFIDAEELEALKRFLLSFLKENRDYRLRKVLMKTISLLVNNICHEDGQGHAPYGTSAGEFFLCDQRVSEMDFYCFLKQLSKLRAVPGEYVRLSDSDPIVIKRYKIKIISHSTVAPVKELKELMSFINVNDSRLGWTLSKSIYRISKHVDRSGLVADLKALISKPIFGDEQLWINVMSLLGFFVFDGYDVGEICLINEALLYDKEFMPKSTNVRETALFLCWSRLRSSFPIGDVIHTVVFASLFDRELICRRAAASIVQEYVGRNQSSEDFRAMLGMELADGILQIDSDSIKRPGNCLKIFCLIDQKQFYRQLVFTLLYSFSRPSRIQAAEIIARFYDLSLAPVRYKTINEMDGLHLLALNVLKMSKPGQIGKGISQSSNFDMSSDTLLKKQFKNTLGNFTLTPQMYKLRNIREAIESYLKLHEIVDPEPFKENIMFLISKNFAPELILDAVQPFLQDLEFSKRVFSTISKNPSGILANSKNYHFSDQCIRRFMANLENNIHVGCTIRALSEMGVSTDQAKHMIGDFLNDYTVDMCGDSGYFNRKEALLYFLRLGQDEGCLTRCVSIEHFVIRFMADKSKRLREDVLASLLSSNYARFEPDFGYMAKNLGEEHPPMALALSEDCSSKIEKFFLKHAELSKEYGNEEAYFRALFISFSDCEHFYHGIINTLNASDRRLIEIITELIHPLKDAFVNTALELIKGGRLFVYQSLRLLLAFKDETLVRNKLNMVDRDKLDVREKALLTKILNECP